MAKPSAPGVQIRRWTEGKWTESPDMVVTEEPLQLMLDGEALIGRLREVLVQELHQVGRRHRRHDGTPPTP